MKLHLLFSGLAFAAVAVASNASATQLNISGVTCNPFNAADATVIDYRPNGVANIASTAKPVICGAVQTSPNSNGKTIYIDGYHQQNNQTTTCTVYVYQHNGSLLYSTTVSWTGLGAWEKTVSLTAAQDPQWAYDTVLCTLPASSGGYLIGITTAP
jgi:hypothetical protein